MICDYAFVGDTAVTQDWISDRMHLIDASGIRKVFDLAADMTDPINLSIGQPDFPTPQPVKDAICEAIQTGHTGYSQTQGIRPLIERVEADVAGRFPGQERKTFITGGTSGGLMLSLCTLVNPGDEVIIFDPYFVMYKHLTRLAGGVPVIINTYPDFRIDIEKVRAAITDRTRVILCNSPANPTGYVASQEELAGLAQLAAEKNIALISDEIYKHFLYDGDFISPASFNENVLVIDGFSKSHAMTGLRLGVAHGPPAVIEQMAKLQQFTFVCAPHPVQWGGITAMETDVSEHVEAYRRKRDMIVSELKGQYEIHGAGGAFYLFAKAPWGTGTEFVKEAIANNLLIIPGNVFSEEDTHFRLSFAASDETLERGIAVLKKIAAK